MDLSSTIKIKTSKLKSNKQWKNNKKLVATTVSSRWMTMCSQDETTTNKEQEDDWVMGKGGGRQSLKHIDGDVLMCMRNEGKDDELKSEKTEKREVKAEAENDFDTLTVTYQTQMKNGLKSKEKEKSSSNRAKTWKRRRK